MGGGPASGLRAGHPICVSYDTPAELVVACIRRSGPGARSGAGPDFNYASILVSRILHLLLPDDKDQSRPRRSRSCRLPSRTRHGARSGPVQWMSRDDPGPDQGVVTISGEPVDVLPIGGFPGRPNQATRRTSKLARAVRSGLEFRERIRNPCHGGQRRFQRERTQPLSPRPESGSAVPAFCAPQTGKSTLMLYAPFISASGRLQPDLQRRRSISGADRSLPC